MDRRALCTLALGLLACGGGTAAGGTPTDTAVRLEVGTPRAAAGATAMGPVCGSEEPCDGVDSDCDGHIDEACEGVTAAPVEVAVAWNGPADLDLGLEAPTAEGASVEVDCEGPRLERRSRSALAPGAYRVTLRHVDACGADAPVTASVTLSVDGEVRGVFNREVAAGAEVEIVALDVTPAD